MAVRRVENHGQCSNAWVDRRSFFDVIQNKNHDVFSCEEGTEKKFVVFSSEEEEMERYSKAYTGVIKYSTRKECSPKGYQS